MVVTLLLALIASYVLTEAAGKPWRTVGVAISVVVPFVLVLTYAIHRRTTPRRAHSAPAPGTVWAPSRRRRVAALGLFVAGLIFRSVSADPLFYALVAAAVALFLLDIVLLFGRDEEEG